MYILTKFNSRSCWLLNTTSMVTEMYLVEDVKDQIRRGNQKILGITQDCKFNPAYNGVRLCLDGRKNKRNLAGVGAILLHNNNIVLFTMYNRNFHFVLDKRVLISPSGKINPWYVTTCHRNNLNYIMLVLEDYKGQVRLVREILIVENNYSVSNWLPDYDTRLVNFIGYPLDICLTEANFDFHGSYVGA